MRDAEHLPPGSGGGNPRPSKPSSAWAGVALFAVFCTFVVAMTIVIRTT